MNENICSRESTISTKGFFEHTKQVLKFINERIFADFGLKKFGLNLLRN